jgi:Restriction endonuclease NaeI
MDEGHPDFSILARIRDALLTRAGGSDRLKERLPEIIHSAIDFVVDPVRTARNSISDLDNVEKTFIGLKIEHFFRDYLDLPKGIRDLKIDGIDVDVKNTIGTTWMIPPETYRQEEACILIASAQKDRSCRLGLMVARDNYLTKPNRDGKRGVGGKGRENILWLVEKADLPASRWHGIDMLRFRDLRKLKPGALRAAQFFRENLGLVVHRSVIQSLLFDQDDYMKRLRVNGGARDLLEPEGILLLSGTYDSPAAKSHGFLNLSADEFVSVRSRI